MAAGGNRVMTLRAVATLLLTAALGLLVAGLIYNHCGQGTAADPPCLADRAPLLTSPVFMVGLAGAVGLLAWAALEAALRRRR